MLVHTITRLSALVIAVLLSACSHVDEVTPRTYVGLVVGHSAPLKIDIAKSLITFPGKPVPQAGPLQLPTPTGVEAMKYDFGWVTAGGAIVIQNSKFSVVVLQEPTFDKGKVTWSCVVHPSEAKPNLCGSDYQNVLLQNQ